MTGFISVYISAASMAEAEIIARNLVENRLAACVNILPPVRSVYRWQGKIENNDEVVLIAKSSAELFSDLEQAVKRLSSYSCPCIVAWPIAAASAEYLAWVGEALRK